MICFGENGDRLEMMRSGQGSAVFYTTQWTLLRSAGDGAGLEELCRIYWRPLYGYARRRGMGAQDAEDVVQEFFVNFLQAERLQRLSPEQGKLRAYLLAGLKGHIAGWRRSALRKKRGGGATHLSLDYESAEALLELDAGTSPEAAYDADWARTLLDHVLLRLQQQFANEGGAGRFELLNGYLIGSAQRGDFSEIAEELGISIGAARVAVHRLRRRFRETLMQELARTLDSPEAAEEELASLFVALGRG